MLKRCPICGSLNRKYAIACRKCDYMLPEPVAEGLVKCPYCNNINPDTNYYCTNCGYMLRYVKGQGNLLHKASLFAWLEDPDLASAEDEAYRDSKDDDTSRNASAPGHPESAEPANNSNDNADVSPLRLPKDVEHKLGTVLVHLKSIDFNRLPRIYEQKQGSSKTLREDGRRLVQAYASRAHHHQLKDRLNLAKLYDFSKWASGKQAELVNRMAGYFSNLHGHFDIPKFLYRYSYLFKDYLHQVKGDQGESLAIRNLRSHGYQELAHNVNIPFDYCDYYSLKYHKAYAGVMTRSSNINWDDYKKYKAKYKKSAELEKQGKLRRNNQIDILYIDHSGIFIFEVKNYNHNKIWIDKHGRIAWQNPKYKSGSRYGHQHGMSVAQQIDMHKEAFMSLLRHSELFSSKELKRIYNNLFGILTYVKKVPHHNILGGVYKYDYSLRDHSEDFNIHPFSQDACAKAVQELPNQFSFSDDLISRIREAIKPRAELPFTLPVFTRLNVKTLNEVLDFKIGLQYLFRTLRHECFKQGMLDKILDRADYEHFKNARHDQYELMRYWHKRASYQYFNHRQQKWVTVNDKYGNGAKYYHKQALKRYHGQRKIYYDFYA